MPDRSPHAAPRRRVYLTVDVEPDCPPYLWTWRGIEEGMPLLLALLAEEGVPATCFVTGATAERYPDLVRAIVAAGHEVGCHGYTHGAFSDFSTSEAEREIRSTNSLLRAFAPVVSFRAPYLRLPERFLPLLAADGIAVDASRSRYKRHEPPNRDVPQVARLAASITSSALRLPQIMRDPWLRMLADPVVLFVHPWEFVDLTRTRLRLDCRFRTGRPALESLRAAIRLLRRRETSFELVGGFRS